MNYLLHREKRADRCGLNARSSILLALCHQASYLTSWSSVFPSVKWVEYHQHFWVLRRSLKVLRLLSDTSINDALFLFLPPPPPRHPQIQKCFPLFLDSQSLLCMSVSSLQTRMCVCVAGGAAGQCLTPMACTGPEARSLNCTLFDIKLVRVSGNSTCVCGILSKLTSLCLWVCANIPKYPYFAGAAGRLSCWAPKNSRKEKEDVQRCQYWREKGLRVCVSYAFPFITHV